MATLKFTRSCASRSSARCCRRRARLRQQGIARLRPRSNSVAPLGVARGTTVEMTVEGLNLARASAIYFSEPGVTGRILRVKELPDLSGCAPRLERHASTIDLGPLPPRNQVTVEVEVSPEAEIGPVSFRLLTPLGTSPEGRLPGRALLRRGARPEPERYTRDRLRDVPARDPRGHDLASPATWTITRSTSRPARRSRSRTARC